jgi:WD40 repeat protein
VFSLIPIQLANKTIGETSDSDTAQGWEAALIAQGGDTVRSYSWYPFMNSNDPATCCFLATCRDQPIHLFDAYSGSIRASYRPYNALDEMESPTMVQFSTNGQRIWAGGFRTDRCLHRFDLSIPGRQSTMLRLGQTRRSSDGQKGLVSALAGTADGRILTVGTYAPGSIYVYDDRIAQQPNGTVLAGVCVVGHGRSYGRKKRRLVSMEEGKETSDDAVSIFSQARIKWFQSRAHSGVCQLQFSPGQDYILYSASRRSDTVLSWDLRMLSGNPDYQSEPISGIRSFATSSDTNQRLEFDLDGCADRIFIGGLDHCVRCLQLSLGIASIAGRSRSVR